MSKDGWNFSIRTNHAKLAIRFHANHGTEIVAVRSGASGRRARGKLAEQKMRIPLTDGATNDPNRTYSKADHTRNAWPNISQSLALSVRRNHLSFDIRRAINDLSFVTLQRVGIW